MLKLNTLIMLVLTTVIVTAQSKTTSEFKVTTSTPYKVVDASSKLYISDKNGFTYSVKTNEANVVVQKFDVNTMKEVARNEYNKDLHPYNTAIDLIQVKDKYYYLYESLEKKTDKKTVYARELNTNDASLGSEIKLLTSDGRVQGESNAKVSFWTAQFFNSGNPTPFQIYKSNDDSKVMISYRRIPIKKNDKVNHDLLGFFVFDSALNSIWGQEVEMPYTEEVMNNISYMVGRDGKAYMMALNRDHKDFMLLTISESGKIDVKELEAKDFIFKNLYMKENTNGNINLLGFYANGIDIKFWDGGFDKTSFNTNGIRSFEMTKEGAIVNSKNIEFPIDLINQYESKRSQAKNNSREEKGKAGIRDMVLREYKVYDDGSIFILGEQNYVVVKKQSNGYGSTSYPEFHYEDLVATKLNPQGEVVWMKKLPKRQLSGHKVGGLGISYFEDKGSHYILFLDNLKNASISEDQVPAVHIDGKGGYLTAYKIDDKTGNYTKHTIYNSLKVNGITTYQFQTNRILKASDKAMLVEVYKKDKEDIMIKMEL